jgi:hypothetical protein
VSLEEAGAYLDLANGDVTAALRELSDDAAWEARAHVASAFVPQRAGSAGGGGGGAGGWAEGAAQGLRARFSAAMAAAGGGDAGQKRD